VYVEPITSASPPVFNSAGASVFSVGVVLSRSFSILLKHPFVFIGLAFLAQFPVPIAILLLLHGVLEFWPAAILGAVLAVLMRVFIQGATSFGVHEVLKGSTARFGESLSHMIRILPSTLGVFLAAAFFAAMMELIFLLNNEETALVNSAVYFLAFMLLFLGLWLWLRCCVIIPVFVAERLGPIKAIKRTMKLTDGCLLKIACLYLLTGVTIAVFSRVVNFTLMSFMDEFDAFALAGFLRGIPQSFIYVMTAVIYFELRKVKEGFSVDSLTDVFD